ncbi:TPA: hypothetical protein MDE43_004772 [Klebsiella pneumoniae]|nr:hypothetical protein [Klebsiella pneumoniae]
MSKASTLHQLIMADIRENNARANWQRNQPDYRTLEQKLHPKRKRPNRKRDYRRDGVLLKLCDIQMKFIIKEAMNETNNGQ